MTMPDHSPYSDPEPMADLVEECRCVEAECKAHGVDLHPAHHGITDHHADPVVVSDATSHMVDGISDYGS
jgi:hypothetical protein